MGLRPAGLVAVLALGSGCRDDAGGEGDQGPTDTGASSSAAASSEGAGEADDTAGVTGETGEAGETGETGEPPGPGPASHVYPDIVTLQDQAINKTCSLNAGVCHNGNNYPDLHTVNNVVSTTWAQCGTEVVDPELVFDICEPPGDRLVIGSEGIDAEILTVTVAPADADYEDLTSATIVIDGDATGIGSGATDVTVVRGDTVYDLGAQGVSVTDGEGDTVSLDLVGPYGRWSAKRFLDTRELPWSADRVRVADPNGNGIAGSALGVALLTPGDPWRSYVFMRLLDEQYGDLMPRQCRTWDDRATLALGCWIEGLTTDAQGQPDNVFDPIDYDACTLDVEGMGRCETILGNDLEAIEGIFAARCGGNGCHLGEGVLAEGLDLGEGNVIDALVGVPSNTTDLPLVVAGDPDGSYLLCKLADDCADRIGAVMPSGTDPLAPEELTAIREWIAMGAE